MGGTGQAQWVRSHVERLLQDEWDVCRVAVDDEGDYPFRNGTAACWVGVIESGDGPMVRVFAHAAIGLRASMKLFTELNDIQRRSLSAAVSWGDGVVVVSQTISPIGLTGPVLTQATTSVASMADDIGLLLAGMFGGATPLPVPDPEQEDAK